MNDSNKNHTIVTIQETGLASVGSTLLMTGAQLATIPGYVLMGLGGLTLGVTIYICGHRHRGSG